MDAVVKRAKPGAKPSTSCDQRRRPERTLWYRTVQTHFETWRAHASGPFGESPPAYVEREFRRYLECGILAHGFARAHCDECGHDFLIAFSCKGRGVCPSCNTRRMAGTAAHLADHVFPRLPVRQWVLSVPKRLRYFLQHDAAVQGAVLRLFLRVVERSLQEHSPGCRDQARIGAVAFIHRFGSSLNEHLLCIPFGHTFIAASSMGYSSPPSARTKRMAWSFMRRPGWMPSQYARCKRGCGSAPSGFSSVAVCSTPDGKAMGQWEHGGGFSVDASVCIEGADRPGLERLLRYCARPPFALEHLQQLDAEHLCYHSPKHRPDEPGDLVLTPLELIGKVAALVPPPRSHRHRYYGVLAPNAPLRAAVTALAPVAVPPPANAAGTEEELSYRATSRYLWAMLLARIYEAFPLNCPFCHAEMRIIAFINDASTMRKILDHIGESTRPPSIAPARGPPLWEAATAAEQARNDPQWDLSAPPVPEVEFDQRIAW